MPMGSSYKLFYDDAKTFVILLLLMFVFFIGYYEIKRFLKNLQIKCCNIFIIACVLEKCLYILQVFLNCSWVIISKIASYPGNAILTRTLDSWAQGQVVRYQMQMRSFNLFFGIQLEILVLRHTDNSYSTLQYIHTPAHVI